MEQKLSTLGDVGWVEASSVKMIKDLKQLVRVETTFDDVLRPTP